MTQGILLLGDLRAAFEGGTTPASAAGAIDEATASPSADPRAVAVIVDLRTTVGRAEAKAALRRAAEIAVDAARTIPRIRHVIVAARLLDPVARRFDRFASAIATQFHSQLERSRARDIEFTFLDITDCGDPGMLLTRLRQRAADPAGAHGVVVLGWEDIENAPIAQAARAQYF